MMFKYALFFSMILLTHRVTSLLKRFPLQVHHCKRSFQTIPLQLSNSDVSHSVIAKEEKEEDRKKEELECIAYGLPISVYIDAEIMRYLNLENFLRKLRLQLVKNIPIEELTERNLKRHIETRVSALANQSYVLRYSTPGLPPRRFSDDKEVVSLFQQRKPLHLHVQSVPGKFPPPSESYLIDMEDPLETSSFTMLSFYRFEDIPSPEDFSQQLFELWKPFKTSGRVYVAKEGINAQMAVPSNVLENFRQACLTLPIFQDLYLNIDHRMPSAEFEASQPFKALHIRVRDQIVADGFDTSLDWKKSGREINSTLWNAGLADPDALVLDCRNSYESDVGIFEGAVPLNTTFFRESWDALDAILENVPQDKPILTYCTGGIRCVKINAYLEQKKGFTNVSRLAGGIISYVKELQQPSSSSPEEEGSQTVVEEDIASIHLQRDVERSKFKGVNYVFDERMGSRVTKDVLTACETCGEGFDIYTNCANTDCHIRFIQCSACSDRYSGCCCLSCQQAQLVRGKENSQPMAVASRKTIRSARQQSMNTKQEDHQISKIIELPPEETKEGSSNDSGNGAITRDLATHALDAQLDAITTYCERYSSPEPASLASLRAATLAAYNTGASRMLCSHIQGRLLTMLCSLINAKAVLELGTFTGYSALCLAEGMRGEEAGSVLTCDVDPLALELARAAIKSSEYSHKIEVREQKAMQLLNECQSQGKVFDLVFIDADKKMYIDYLKRILGEEDDSEPQPCLLSDGALIVVDNTLWKGLVLTKVILFSF